MTATVITMPGLPSGLPARSPRRMTPEERDRALHAELRRARIRIAQLECSLNAALRDGLAHLERARAAERCLTDLTGKRTQGA